MRKTPGRSEPRDLVTKISAWLIVLTCREKVGFVSSPEENVSHHWQVSTGCEYLSQFPAIWLMRWFHSILMMVPVFAIHRPELDSVVDMDQNCIEKTDHH